MKFTLPRIQSLAANFLVLLVVLLLAAAVALSLMGHARPAATICSIVVLLGYLGLRKLSL